METAPLDGSFYKQALIVLAAAGVVIPLFHRLHISAVLGFMLVGVVVGPFGLASLTPHLPWLSAITASAVAAGSPLSSTCRSTSRPRSEARRRSVSRSGSI